jgi:hypothetical protein
MATIELKYFGKIELEKAEDYYDATINIAGKFIELNLDFEGEPANLKQLKKLQPALDHLAELDQKNRAFLVENYNKEEIGENIRNYCKLCLERIEKADLAKVIDLTVDADAVNRQILEKMSLLRIGFMPEDKENFIVFDYSIDPELTDYMLVFLYNDNLEIDYISIES